MRPATLGPALALALACWGGPQPEPSPTGAPAGARGTASWFATGPAGVAAAGRALRDALGPSWRHSRVRVTANGRSVTVTLGDWCGCPGGRVIDLDAGSFARLAPLSRGLVTVEESR